MKVRPLRLLQFAALLALSARLTSGAQAQGLPFDTATARSVSGQFIVFNPQRVSPTPDLSSDASLVKLEPSLLAVMCERIKQALAEEIGPGGPWCGKTYFTLHAARSADEEIAFLAERFKDGWVYRINLPNPVERTRLIRAVVQAILLEQANRTADGRSAEIPLWLSEGLMGLALDARGLEVILPPPHRGMNQLKMSPITLDARRTNAGALARVALGECGPLSLEALSWPKEDQLAGPDARHFQLSAQLFVAELLRFEDGRACLRSMIDELPKFLNWQMAFLRGFKPHFNRQLDVEKWWALQTEFMTGRDENGLWSAAESWAKLDQILRASVQVRREKKDLPSVAEVSLATVIRDWDFGRQALTLRDKLAELNSARARVAAEVLQLVDEYRQLIADYLSRRDNTATTLAGHRGEVTNARLLVREMLKQFAGLESKRRQLKPKSVTPGAAAAPAGRVK